MDRKKAAFHNLGCKVNAYEQEAMQQLLEEEGYEIVPFDEKADVYVVNTCTVTNIADRKSRQMLHRARKANPDGIVVAAGCYAQTAFDDLAGDGSVDIILGNNKKGELSQAIREYERTRRRVADVCRIEKEKKVEPLHISHTDQKVRAFLKVTDGCNQFCSYCLIPYARGRVRSRSIEDVVSEVKMLAACGYPEIVLTGIHLSSFGIDASPDQTPALLNLIQAVSEVNGIHRIRLGSLEPRIITESFVRTLSGIEAFCPHFHLSLQSGCDSTLTRMNRRYSTLEYREKCEMIREYFPHPALTTDIIVGFPQESEEDFEKSYTFVDSIRFYETHVFRYSSREGTRAAAMDGQIPEEIKAARSEKMIALNKRRMKEFEESVLGKKLSVLIEEKKRTGEEWYFIGHSREYIPVAVPESFSPCPGEEWSVTAKSFAAPHLLLADGDCSRIVRSEK